MDGLHVVLGTAAIGPGLVDELNLMGLRVRAVNRSGHADVPDAVEVIAGDASNPEFAARAVAAASVVYQCLNFESWVPWKG